MARFWVSIDPREISYFHLTSMLLGQLVTADGRLVVVNLTVSTGVGDGCLDNLVT